MKTLCNTKSSICVFFSYNVILIKQNKREYYFKLCLSCFSRYRKKSVRPFCFHALLVRVQLIRKKCSFEGYPPLPILSQYSHETHLERINHCQICLILFNNTFCRLWPKFCPRTILFLAFIPAGSFIPRFLILTRDPPPKH